MIAQYGTTEEPLTAPGPNTLWQRNPTNDGWESVKPKDLLKLADDPISLNGQRMIGAGDPVDPQDLVTLKTLTSASVPLLTGTSTNGAQVVLAKYPVSAAYQLLLEITAVVDRTDAVGGGPWKQLVFCSRGTTGDVVVAEPQKLLTPGNLGIKNVPTVVVVGKPTEVWLVGNGAANQVWAWRARVVSI